MNDKCDSVVFLVVLLVGIFGENIIESKQNHELAMRKIDLQIAHAQAIYRQNSQ